MPSVDSGKRCKKAALENDGASSKAGKTTGPGRTAFQQCLVRRFPVVNFPSPALSTFLYRNMLCAPLRSLRQAAPICALPHHGAGYSSAAYDCVSPIDWLHMPPSPLLLQQPLVQSR